MFRATESDADRQLTRLVDRGAELSTTGPVEMELLAGARNAGELVQVRSALAACRMVPVLSASDWREAAAIYRSCRRAGATPRRLLACVIAAVALRAGVPVLAQDRDFELIADHTALELAT